MESFSNEDLLIVYGKLGKMDQSKETTVGKLGKLYSSRLNLRVQCQYRFFKQTMRKGEVPFLLH